jgi:Holliday junction resolvase
MELESKLQKKIINQLQKEGWLCIKLIKTTVNGIPDLICHRQGETMYIEVKRPTGKLSELQKVRIKQLQEQGVTVKIWVDYDTEY